MPSGCRVDGVEIDSQNMRCARANTLSGLALGAGLGLLALALALAASARFAASACAFVRLSPRAGDAWLSVSVSLSVSVDARSRRAHPRAIAAEGRQCPPRDGLRTPARTFLAAAATFFSSALFVASAFFAAAAALACLAACGGEGLGLAGGRRARRLPQSRVH